MEFFLLQLLLHQCTFDISSSSASEEWRVKMATRDTKQRHPVPSCLSSAASYNFQVLEFQTFDNDKNIDVWLWQLVGGGRGGGRYLEEQL